jgi:hypothetical protein
MMLVADVSASGMNDGDWDDDTMRRNILLTVVVEEAKHHPALQIVDKQAS